MKPLPKADVYLEEYTYWPWGKLISQVVDYASDFMSRDISTVRILDVMCGPGYVLGKIQERHPGAIYEGFDISESFIASAKKQFPTINYHVQDVLSWAPKKKYDVVICTGALHHIPYEQQEEVVTKLSAATAPYFGICITGDPLIPAYETEIQRKKSALKLGTWNLDKLIKANAPPHIIETAIDVLHNDVLGHEYKDSLENVHSLLKKHFNTATAYKVSGSPKTGGDYAFVCQNWD